MGIFILGATQTGWAAPQTNSAAVEVQLPTYEITLTGYNAVPGQTDANPMTTAIGAYSDPDIVAARSSDLADELPYGTVIQVEPIASSTSDCGLPYVQDHIGLRVIADAMNARMHNKVDILFGTDDTVRAGSLERNAAKALGFCRDITITVVGHIDTTHMPKSQEELKAMLGDPQPGGHALAVAK